MEKLWELVISSYGMGGHLSYATEIHTLAKAGFVVLTYDNTRIMASEGKSLGSFYQAMKDLRFAIAYVREDAKLFKYKFLLAGHSWGSYAVCQVLACEGAYVVGGELSLRPTAALMSSANVCGRLSVSQSYGCVKRLMLHQ